MGKLGLGLIGLAALASILVPVIVDWNDTHLFNEDWPPHARLHDAMSFLMSMGLGAGALWLIATPWGRRGAGLALAALLSVWSWIALVAAGAMPGTAYVNAAEGAPVAIAGMPPNVIVSLVVIAAGLIGWALAARAD